MIKVLIVEDKFFLMKALKEKLSIFDDIQIKDTADNGKEAIEILEKNHIVDLIFMDIEMPVMNGVEATQLIKAKYPQIKILVLTVFDNDTTIFNAIKAGADGYLLKDATPEKIYQSVQEILAGGAAMSPSIAMKAMKLLQNPIEIIAIEDKKLVQLSPREMEILEQLSTGLTNNQISENLFISSGTVKKHIDNIFTKLNVHNRIEAIQKAKFIK
jgi:DNA-binding NarL/FixJ family response regulator